MPAAWDDARRAFGDYAGFLIGIGSWLGSASAMAFGASVMGVILGKSVVSKRGRRR